MNNPRRFEGTVKGFYAIGSMDKAEEIIRRFRAFGYEPGRCTCASDKTLYYTQRDGTVDCIDLDAVELSERVYILVDGIKSHPYWYDVMSFSSWAIPDFKPGDKIQFCGPAKSGPYPNRYFGAACTIMSLDINYGRYMLADEYSMISGRPLHLYSLPFGDQKYFKLSPIQAKFSQGDIVVDDERSIFIIDAVVPGDQKYLIRRPRGQIVMAERFCNEEKYHHIGNVTDLIVTIDTLPDECLLCFVATPEGITPRTAVGALNLYKALTELSNK